MRALARPKVAQGVQGGLPLWPDAAPMSEAKRVRSNATKGEYVEAESEGFGLHGRSGPTSSTTRNIRIIKNEKYIEFYIVLLQRW